jgi:hypothetical protein
MVFQLDSYELIRSVPLVFGMGCRGEIRRVLAIGPPRGFGIEGRRKSRNC